MCRILLSEIAIRSPKVWARAPVFTALPTYGEIYAPDYYLWRLFSIGYRIWPKKVTLGMTLSTYERQSVQAKTHITLSKLIHKPYWPAQCCIWYPKTFLTAIREIQSIKIIVGSAWLGSMCNNCRTKSCFGYASLKTWWYFWHLCFNGPFYLVRLSKSSLPSGRRLTTVVLQFCRLWSSLSVIVGLKLKLAKLGHIHRIG